MRANRRNSDGVGGLRRTHGRRRTAAGALALALAATALGALPGSAASPAEHTVQTLHFKVQVGPDDEECNIVGDLYTPPGVDSDHPAPAVLTTNGFGGSKTSRNPTGFAKLLVAQGYVVLSYSGLGFGGSDCKITMDDPAWDGAAGSQLISWLGGAPGIAFADREHTQPLPPLDIVIGDEVAQDGTVRPHDPRVGMIGGSYGGHVLYAIASVDPRLDTIVPVYTWNDLSYTLAPNGTGQVDGVSTAEPGAAKLTWGLGFVLLGLASGLEGAATDPSRLFPCPNFADWVCPAVLSAAALGYLPQQHADRLRDISVASYPQKIRIPTLLIQGQNDTLVNLNEAVATYEQLRSRGTEVAMIWQSWGHNGEEPAQGELDFDDPDPAGQYQARRIVAWFDRHLREAPVDTGPAFAYFRDWIEYAGDAEPAYGSAANYPVGAPTPFRLSGRTRLAGPGEPVTAASGSLLTSPGGVPTNLSQPEEPTLFGSLPVPELDLPGTTLSWQTDPLAEPLDVVGSPELSLRVNAPAAVLTQGLGPAGKVVLFVRVQDVDADGVAADIHQLSVPVRVPDVRERFDVSLPAIAHRFSPGHRVRLVIAGSSLNYRGGLVPHVVTVKAGSPDQVLVLPVVPAAG